jgi:hypothetical protein
MNFNAYLNNVLNGKLLTEMQQNDVLLSPDEIKKYKQWFYTALKNNKNSDHFNSAGSDKYLKDSNSLEIHQNANNFFKKIAKTIRPGENGALTSDVTIYPVAQQHNLSAITIVALAFNYNRNTINEIVGKGNDINDFTIITSYEILQENRILAYAFKLRDTKIGQIIQRQLIKKPLESLVPDGMDLKTFEESLWNDSIKTRNIEREDNQKLYILKIIHILENSLNLKTKEQKINTLGGLLTDAIDLSKLPESVRSQIGIQLGKQPKKMQFLIKTAQYIKKYINDLKNSN